jgi:glycosyltransferase involved in cell wall biosynthesis
MRTLACCLCVRDCARYLSRILGNVDRLRILPLNLHVVLLVDNNSTDHSEAMMLQYKCARPNVTLRKITNDSPLRTVRIARARNECLDVVSEMQPAPDFHAMIDADDVNIRPWNVELLQRVLDRSDWDCISFNRPCYYDVWALMFGPYKHHCWGFGTDSGAVVAHIQRAISVHLERCPDAHMECMSAFNGFALYRSSVFEGLQYAGTYGPFRQLVTDDERSTALATLREEMQLPALQIVESLDDQHCEHLHYHVSAIKARGARIRICKHSMFLPDRRP